MSNTSNDASVAVTSGQSYTDIDGLACAIAYTELLRLEGKPANAVLPGPLNETVTSEIKKWGLKYETKPNAPTQAVLVDVSEPDAAARFASPDVVREVFDHHVGFEKFWSDRLGRNSHIEFVGAAATLIWEQFLVRNHENDITQTSARLLYAAIISNTLNFNAELTTDRDHAAAATLLAKAGLNNNWVAQYYQEFEKGIRSDLALAVANDTKISKIPNLDITLSISQLEFWNGHDLLPKHCETIKGVLAPLGHPWFHTTPSISEGKNYLYAEDDNVKKLLSSAIDATFHGNIGESKRLWMRKEILKQLYQLTARSDK